MSKQCVTIHPYFEVAEGKLDEFKAIWEAAVPVVKAETKCVFYEFTFCGNTAFCREGYEDADGVLTHLGNVDSALKKVCIPHFYLINNVLFYYCSYYEHVGSGAVHIASLGSPRPSI